MRELARLSDLQRENIDLSERSATIITLKHKHQHQDSRPVYFDRKACRHLGQYINQGYHSKYPNDSSEYVFITRVDDEIRDRARVLFNNGVERYSEVENNEDITTEQTGRNVPQLHRIFFDAHTHRITLILRVII